MTKVGLLKRINLGNYQHWELWVEIEDADEKKAMERCFTTMNVGLHALDQPKISVEKVE